MTFHVIERNDDTDYVFHIDTRDTLDEAIKLARSELRDIPSTAIEAGFTVIVEDDNGKRVWGVGTNG